MKNARHAFEKMYRGTMNIYEWKVERDPQTLISNEVRQLVVENQPCLLSFSSIPATTNPTDHPSVTQTTKVFTSPDIVVLESSEIEVTQDGVTNIYVRSGKPAVYPTHQEIVVNLKENTDGTKPK